MVGSLVEIFSINQMKLVKINGSGQTIVHYNRYILPIDLLESET